MKKSRWSPFRASFALIAALGLVGVVHETATTATSKAKNTASVKQSSEVARLGVGKASLSLTSAALHHQDPFALGAAEASGNTATALPATQVMYQGGIDETTLLTNRLNSTLGVQNSEVQTNVADSVAAAINITIRGTSAIGYNTGQTVGMTSTNQQTGFNASEVTRFGVGKINTQTTNTASQSFAFPSGASHRNC